LDAVSDGVRIIQLSKIPYRSKCRTHEPVYLITPAKCAHCQNVARLMASEGQDSGLCIQAITARIWRPSSSRSTLSEWLARYALIVSAAKCAVRSRVSRSARIVASSLACSSAERYKSRSARLALIKPFSYASRTATIARRLILEILLRCDGETLGIGQLREFGFQYLPDRLAALNQFAAHRISPGCRDELIQMRDHQLGVERRITPKPGHGTQERNLAFDVLAASGLMPIAVIFGWFDGILDYTRDLACHWLSRAASGACGFNQSPCCALEFRRWESRNRSEHSFAGCRR